MQQFLDSWFSVCNKEDELRLSQLPEGVAEYWNELLNKALEGELASWQKTPPGRLALIILCGPVGRLLTSPNQKQAALKAKSLCHRGIELGFDTQLRVVERRYFYDPLFQSHQTQDRELLQKLLAGMRAPATQSEDAGLSIWQGWWHQAQQVESIQASL